MPDDVDRDDGNGGGGSERELGRSSAAIAGGAPE